MVSLFLKYFYLDWNYNYIDQIKSWGEILYSFLFPSIELVSYVLTFIGVFIFFLYKIFILLKPRFNFNLQRLRIKSLKKQELKKSYKNNLILAKKSLN